MPRLLLLCALVALAACDSGSGDGPRDLPAVDAEAAPQVETAADLEAARARWDALGLDSYELRYRVTCFCAPLEVQVRVENGAVTAAWVNDAPAPEDPASLVLTVEALFDEAQQAFAGADYVSARVGSEAPFLVELYVDASVAIADEEVGYTVVGFEAR